MKPTRSGGRRHPEPDTVRYGLRFQILPGRDALARAREVAAFCRRHRIPAVHLFFNAEEWNRGHVTEAETQQHLRMFHQIIPVFREAGLSVNLNPWSTLLHCDRGRMLRAGQRFERMVSPSGRTARAVASPACRRWRAYLARLFGRMAALGFDTIWIEDDWRYHNHAPLDWGGDFSASMLRRFARRIGRKRVSRAQVLRHVLAPGRPHPWRREWLGLWREVSEENAAALRDAVAAANPRARLGLMSSHPDMHAAEGRRWESLFKALAINGRAVHRPHFGSYGETTGPHLINSCALLDVQKGLRPAWVESHPEIENFVFGRFSKSDAMTFAQMALCKVMGSEGLLLDLHAMTGNRVLEEHGMGPLLDRSRPALAWLAAEFPRSLTARGVGVLFREESAETLRLPPKSRYDDLFCPSERASFLLGASGIAFQMRPSPDSNALWGRKAWTYSDREVFDLLGRGLWLDADAADILVQRGFGGYLGIRARGWLERESALYAVERVVSRSAGVRLGFNAGCNLFTRVLQFDPRPGAQTWTEVRDCMDRRVGTGLSVFANDRGGTVAVSAFPLHAELHSLNLNFQRQALFQRLVVTLSGGRPPVTTRGAPYVLPIEMRGDPDRKIVAMNLWTDPARPVVHIPRAERALACTLIRPLEKPRPAVWHEAREHGGLAVRAAATLPYCGMLMLSVR
jgi:hypothetical protein